jgi:hypothetical protein
MNSLLIRFQSLENRAAMSVSTPYEMAAISVVRIIWVKG